MTAGEVNVTHNFVPNLCHLWCQKNSRFQTTIRRGRCNQYRPKIIYRVILGSGTEPSIRKSTSVVRDLAMETIGKPSSPVDLQHSRQLLSMRVQRKFHRLVVMQCLFC